MSIDVYPNPVDVILGTMAQQNANAVAITGGAISIGGHAPTGVLDVQSSVVASDVPGQHFGVRVWPVAPSGASVVEALRIEPATGAGLASAGIIGIDILNPPGGIPGAQGIALNVAAGTNRLNVYAPGTAPNYFAGSVGIGTNPPSYPLDVTGQVRVTSGLGLGTTPAAHRLNIAYDRSNSQGIAIQPSVDSGPGGAILFANAANAAVGSITTTGSATAYNTSSDVRLKHAIATLTGSLDVIASLRPVRFRWNADDSVGHGFLAHELQQVVPDAVTGEPDAINDDGSILPQQVDHSKLIPWLVGAIKELVARVEYLETQLGV